MRVIRVRFRVRPLMAKVSTITLFAPPPRPSGGSPSWVVSAVVHAGACAWIFYGLARVPHIEGHTLHQRFTVRVLDVPMTRPEAIYYPNAASPVQPAAPVSTKASIPSLLPAPPASASLSAPAVPPPMPAASKIAPAPALPASIQLAQKTHQEQTLIQPDAPKDLLLQQAVPLPMVMMWAQQPPPKPAIAAPPAKPILANMRPSIARPNREATPAPINVSSTSFHSAMPTLSPGATSPVVVHSPDAAKQMPVAAAQTTMAAAPVRILSLSDRQQQEGPVAIPLANASARPSSSQSFTAGKAAGTGGTGSPSASGKQTTVASIQSSGVGQGSGSKVSGDSGSDATAKAAASPGAQIQNSAGIGTELPAGMTRITRSKDGKFDFTVVGSSLQDQYPETAAIWAGRLVYTVYLRVGMGKSWILQYSLPAATQAAAVGGKPDAPWPYDIVVPRLDAADYSDALMVHGFVNEAGKFEKLNLVLPAEFAQAKFVMNALNQWQFRAARQNSQPTPVEVLLIIPEQDD